MGFSIGITGWICDDIRGKELREAVKLIPLDRILIETDAPYLTPKNVDGLSRVNVPERINCSCKGKHGTTIFIIRKHLLPFYLNKFMN